MTVELYVDGACSNNGYIGATAGWAWCLVVDGNEVFSDSGQILNSTNNQGELQAAIAGLEFISENANNLDQLITVITDSKYVYQGYNEWMPRWKKNAWMRDKRNEIKNKEYWQSLDRLGQQLNIKIEWIKSHQNIGNFNDYVDKLARAQTKI